MKYENIQATNKLRDQLEELYEMRDFLASAPSCKRFYINISDLVPENNGMRTDRGEYFDYQIVEALLGAQITANEKILSDVVVELARKLKVIE